LNLFCFSTVEPGGGGTRLVEGSHHLAAGLLWQAEPEGMSTDDFDEPLTAALDGAGWPGVVEVAAEEGDVLLAHPLIFHASNPNHGTRPRVMAQPEFSMTEPMRTDGERSFPVEVPLESAPDPEPPCDPLHTSVEASEDFLAARRLVTANLAADPRLADLTAVATYRFGVTGELGPFVSASPAASPTRTDGNASFVK
jgi:hypothetical protein